MKFNRTLLLFILIFSVERILAQAPGCPNVDAGPDQTLNCVTNCTDLTATIFQTGETSDYIVSSIPYAPPFPFTGGNQVFINVDDLWTGVINLPFNFCFYGNMYNKIVVGTNGVLCFDLSHANNTCEWQFNQSIPTSLPPGIPDLGVYSNSINGAFHDIDPAVPVAIPVFPFFGNPSNINYAVLGTAPCRTFVVNFSTVPHYQCNNLRTNQQIVLYETTNVIEVYIKDKPTCSSWNGGNAVIGLQNIDGTKGITPPGRNTGPWSATNEAWRFTPNGTPNWTLTWFGPTGAMISNSPTINVCPIGTQTYTVQGVYQACDGSVVTVQDQVTVGFSNAFTTAFTKTDETCAGCDGSINVTVTGGTGPFTYDIGNGPQANGNFTGLCDGNYTISVGDAASCDGVVNVTIAPAAIITVSEASTNETCAGQNDGTITLSATGGTGPYTYNIGVGAPNNTGIFSGLAPMTYSYIVTDAGGCSATGSITIATAQVCCTMTNTVVSSNPTCNAACDGTITLTESLGNAPVQFSIDNGTTFQATGNFSGLCAGNYNILIQDAANCQFTRVVTLSDPAAVNVSGIAVDATCGCDGSITASGNGGAGGPFQYSLDGGAFQGTTLFSNICPGARAVTARDVTGCTGTTTVTIGNVGALAINNIVVTHPSCNGMCDASIVIDASGAAQYSIDNGVNFQVGNSFSNLCQGTYNIVVTDGGLCQITDVAIVTDPALLTLAAVPTDVLCHTDCNGIIDNTAAGGTLPYQFSLDNGTTFQAASQFTGLCAGAYTILVSDAHNCTALTGTTVSEPSELSVMLQTTDASCPQVCNGAIDISPAGGTGPYQFSLPGVPPTGNAQISGLCAGDFQLTVTDNGNCSITSDFTIHEPQGITISAGDDDSVRIGEAISLNPSFSDANSVSTVLWSPATGLSCTACVNPVASPPSTTIYTLTVNDNEGCTYTDDVQVIVYSNPLVNIPNAFTPNGDGVNDIFYITGWEIHDFRLFVFNRWGEKIFETDNITHGWDGTYRGKKLAPDVFTYLIDVVYLTGSKDVFKGSLTLLK